MYQNITFAIAALVQELKQTTVSLPSLKIRYIILTEYTLNLLAFL